MHGSCLCGAVQFKVKLDRLKVYQCHCSLCRKQTGTAASSGSIVPTHHLEWLGGENFISRWVKDSGFTSHFCRVCGSSVPNQFRGNAYYWVPAGLIDDGNLEVSVNIFTCDAVGWSQVDRRINPYESRPDVETMLALLAGEQSFEAPT